MKTNLNLMSVLLMLSLSIGAQIGPPYDLSHNVIAGGGGSQSTGGQFTLDGTIGQPLAGTQSNGGSFRLRGGFWAQPPLAPTAAEVSISGRIKTADGRGIRNVRLVLANSATGEIFQANSSLFGYYRFEGIAVGQSYVLTVRAKLFEFDPSMRVIMLQDELTDFDFTALEGKE